MVFAIAVNYAMEKVKRFCKKITIAVFNSGKIIITGAQSIIQLNISYDFIKEILDENKSELLIPENPMKN